MLVPQLRYWIVDLGSLFLFLLAWWKWESVWAGLIFGGILYAFGAWLMWRRSRP